MIVAPLPGALYRLLERYWAEPWELFFAPPPLQRLKLPNGQQGTDGARRLHYPSILSLVMTFSSPLDCETARKTTEKPGSGAGYRYLYQKYSRE